jgi:hypothetical protein
LRCFFTAWAGGKKGASSVCHARQNSTQITGQSATQCKGGKGQSKGQLQPTTTHKCGVVWVSIQGFACIFPKGSDTGTPARRPDLQLAHTASLCLVTARSTNLYLLGGVDPVHIRLMMTHNSSRSSGVVTHPGSNILRPVRNGSFWKNLHANQTIELLGSSVQSLQKSQQGTCQRLIDF